MIAASGGQAVLRVFATGRGRDNVQPRVVSPLLPAAQPTGFPQRVRVRVGARGHVSARVVPAGHEAERVGRGQAYVDAEQHEESTDEEEQLRHVGWWVGLWFIALTLLFAQVLVTKGKKGK